MSIRVECPSCKKTLESPEEYAGRTAVCPTCRTKLAVPVKNVIEIAPRLAPESIPTFGDYLSALPIIVAVAAAFVCLATFRGPDGAGVVHYISLIIFVGMSSLLILRRFIRPVRWQRTCALLIAIIVAVVWGRFDYSIRTWSKPNEDGDGTNRFTDYVYRGKTRPFYREFDSSWGKSNYYHARGGFSDSFKKHGKWEMSEGDWAKFESASNRSWDEWYWYGEEVSEGDWHLRSRK